MPLDALRANACREGFEQAVDDIGSMGDSAHGMHGMLDQPNVPSFTIPAGASGKTDFKDKTPDEVIADINNFGANIFKLTKQREAMSRLLLPTDAYAYIAQTPRSPVSDTTILEFILKSSKYFKEIDTWVRLDGAGSGGSDRMMGYTPDPSKLVMIVPMEQTPYPPEQRGLGIRINTEGEIGGVVFYKPYSASYADGV